MFDENLFWQRKLMLERAAKGLRENGFEVMIAGDCLAAKKMIKELISPSEKVGVGGSMTIERLEIIPELLSRGIKVLSHSLVAEREERKRLRYQAVQADVYLGSPQAVTIDGKLLFIDHIGNRIAGMCFGPKKVIAVAGINKIAPDEESGWWRAKNIAAVANAKRLKLNTPCTSVGYCTDCKSSERICRAYLKLEKKPANTEYWVLLVGEELGY